jgi:hypothetical protein
MSRPLTDSACHISMTMGPDRSEVVLSWVNMRISEYWNESPQNRWFFAISHNIGGFAYFPLKCGGFLEFSRAEAIWQILGQVPIQQKLPRPKLTIS